MRLKMTWKLLALMSWVSLASGLQQSTNQLPDRSTIVHLFEWKWSDVAVECERFLGPKGYGGVQVSPASENLVIELSGGGRPWWERYQVMSYKLLTRSGNEQDFLDMTTRCNKVGVRIYVDTVVNHMTGDGQHNVGTGGSTADFSKLDYPAVPYTKQHFHPECSIKDYNNAAEVRDCKLVGLRDLDLGNRHVRDKVVEFLNTLIKLGVAGFRVDAAKHMWPSDLQVIYSRLHSLNTSFGFPEGSRPYIYQEVIYYGGEAVTPQEYTPLGAVTEFKAGSELSNAFRGDNPLKWLRTWGAQWGLMPNESAFVFIDNHDSQRGHGGGGRGAVLTYKEPRAYKAAVAFLLAHPFGEPRVMSSYHFVHSDQGPPADTNQDILSPTINSDDTCGNGWVCEHRWRQIYQMVGFRNAVKGTNLEGWWDNGNNQIAFSRGSKGFIAFNIEQGDLDQRIKTNLPPGEYCDVISGSRMNDSCSGVKLTVDREGYTRVRLPSLAEDHHLAVHVGPQSSLQHRNK